MAMILGGRTVITTAGTRVQVNNTPRRVISILLKGRDSNTGKVYVGDSTVSSTAGLELKANQGVTIPSPGPAYTFLISDIWVDAATNGDIVDWLVELVP